MRLATGKTEMKWASHSNCKHARLLMSLGLWTAVIGVGFSSGCRSSQLVDPPVQRHALQYTPTLRMVHTYINSNPADREQLDNQQMGRATRENLKRLCDAGVNAVYFHGDSMVDPGVERSDPDVPWWRDQRVIARIEEGVGLCCELDLKVFFVPYFGSGVHHYPHVELDPSRDHTGQYSEREYRGRPAYVPSWFDPNYQDMIIERDRTLARIVGKGLADGVLLEPEVYTDVGALSERGQLDYGDVAYERFFRDMRATEAGVRGHMAVPRDKRQAQLTRDGLLGNYAEWQMNDLRRFAARWANALREEAPGIKLGFYQPGPWFSWSLRSLAQGMYDRTYGPLLIMDASTYYAHPKQWVLGFDGSLADFEQFRQTVLSDWGVRAYVVNGLCPYLFDKENPERTAVWKQASEPDAIVRFLRESRQNGNGWWIWNESRNPARIRKHIRQSESDAVKTAPGTLGITEGTAADR